jgi:hypothetical protein
MVVMPCQTMSMVVVHVASGTRDILAFWAAWPRLWATLYNGLLNDRNVSRVEQFSTIALSSFGDGSPTSVKEARILCLLCEAVYTHWL